MGFIKREVKNIDMYEKILKILVDNLSDYGVDFENLMSIASEIQLLSEKKGGEKL